MIKRTNYFLLLSFFAMACSQKNDKTTRAIVESFYDVYSQRADLERFMNFYSPDIVLVDMINGDKISGKQNVKEFFSWENPDFKLLGNRTLVVNDIFVDHHTATILGYFTAFQWGKTIFQPMYFTTILTLNNDGKIMKQVDWINYPSSLLDYSKRKNSNEWIPTSQK